VSLNGVEITARPAHLLARALVFHPSVVLLDEPLGTLDLKLRKAMQLELKTLQREIGLTFVYVTHDQEESLTMSDRIAVMGRGRVLQWAIRARSTSSRRPDSSPTSSASRTSFLAWCGRRVSRRPSSSTVAGWSGRGGRRSSPSARR